MPVHSSQRGAAPAAGDPSLTESLVANLVDNALRHNVADGRVEVVTRADGGRSVISVRNTGPQVSADEVDRLFQPFASVFLPMIEPSRRIPLRSSDGVPHPRPRS